MGKIPEFTRTVLPQNAQYGLVDVARQAGASEAAQHRQNASNIDQTVNNMRVVESQLNEIKLREAVANNTTWVNENVIQYKRDTADMLDQMRKQRAENPLDFHKDFDKELEKRQNDFLKNAPSQAASMAMRQSLGSIRESYYEDNLSWETQRQTERFGESMDRTADNIAVLAYRAGQDGKALEETGLMNDVDASVIAGSTFIAGDKLEKVKGTMSRSAVSSYLEGVFDKNPAKAKELLNSRQYDEILGADEIQRFDAKIRAQEKLQVNDMSDEIEIAAKMGIPVPREKIMQTADLLDSVGSHAQARDMREFADVQDAVIDFAAKPMKQQAQILEDMKAQIQGGDLANVKKFAAMSDVLQTKQDAIQKDPWSYYAARDIVRDPEALDFSNPALIGHELDQRRLAVQQVKDLDNITMPLFTDAELDNLKKVYDTAKPEEIASLTASIGQSMSNEEQGALARAMAEKSAPLAVALAVGDPAVSEKIIMGTQIQGLVTKNDFRAELLGRMQNIVTDPLRFEQLHDAIYSYYKTLQFQSKDTDKAVNADRLEQSITDIMGPIVEVDTYTGWGGVSNVLSYRDDLTGAYKSADDIQDLLMGLNDEKIMALNGGKMPVGTAGTKFTTKDILKSGRFVSDGDGIYAVIDPMGEPVGNEDGSIFRINMRQLEKLVGKK